LTCRKPNHAFESSRALAAAVPRVSIEELFEMATMTIIAIGVALAFRSERRNGASAKA
jgi:hypothetical protein